MSQRRKTAKSETPDARQEAGAPQDIEKSDDSLDHSGKGNGGSGDGATWLDRVKASADLVNGESESPFFSSEPVELEPAGGSPAVPEPQQVDLPWSRTDESDQAFTPEPTQESAAVQMEQPVHIVDSDSLPPDPGPIDPELQQVITYRDADEPLAGDSPAGSLSAATLMSGSIPEQTPGPAIESSVGLSIGRLRTAALEMARRDAEAGLPALDADGRSESEQELRDRSQALFSDWSARQRDRLNSLVSETEGRITEASGEVALNIDRFDRATTELFRLKKRQEVNRSLVESTLDRQAIAQGETEALLDEQEEKSEARAFKTHWYALAIGFLGVVEFLANAPVFGALLPRDPLTEQQIRFVAETSEGWAAGFQRVVSQFILRPDAALLAAGVVTFLCVLAHFFGHSLRRLLMHKSASQSGETIRNRSASEYVVPMVLSGLGLALVLGVLFEARVTLGEVATDRFAQDSSKIEELRRTASWLRVDGNLVAANEQANRADDLEALAKEQREYAASMSGLSFPILLLNTTLVLVAISAAYFHLRDPRRDRFNELPWERQRRELVDLGDSVQQRIVEGQGQLVRRIGELKNLLTEKPLKEAPAMAHQLEATIVAYRAENGRLRGLDPREIPAFAEPVRLELVVDEQAPHLQMRDAAGYEDDRRELVKRFEEIRGRFTREATTW
jgi:hypothetical protein